MSDNMDEPLPDELNQKAWAHGKNYGFGPYKPKIPSRKFLIAYGFLNYYKLAVNTSLEEMAETLSELIKDDY